MFTGGTIWVLTHGQVCFLLALGAEGEADPSSGVERPPFWLLSKRSDRTLKHCHVASAHRGAQNIRSSEQGVRLLVVFKGTAKCPNPTKDIPKRGLQRLVELMRRNTSKTGYLELVPI